MNEAMRAGKDFADIWPFIKEASLDLVIIAKWLHALLVT